MSWYKADVKTKEGKKKYAETIIAIAEKVIVNTLLLLGGAYAVDVFSSVSRINFNAYLWIAILGSFIGLILLFKGTSDFDKLHRE